MEYFNKEDLALIENLKYDPNLKPSYDLIKGCLVWPDEIPSGLSSEGLFLLGYVLPARGLIQKNIPFNSKNHAVTRVFGSQLEKAWNLVLSNNLKWPGMRRLNLSAEDMEYLKKNEKEPIE